jgi:CHAT domain-containing protein
MSALYEARLAGRSTAESVRHASLTTLDALRRKGRTPHPYFWGAFVAAGDWD